MTSYAYIMGEYDDVSMRRNAILRCIPGLMLRMRSI